MAEKLGISAVQPTVVGRLIVSQVLAGKKKRPDFRDRALYWYGRSLAKSTGLERTRVLQRMREIRGDIVSLDSGVGS